MSEYESIPPHGNLLVSRLAADSERETLIERAQSMPNVTLDEWGLSDLELIAVGAFSPLRGFMNSVDYRSVCENMRLANGLVWTIPVCLQVSHEQAANLKEGAQVALVDEQKQVRALLDLSEKFVPDQEAEAQKVFRTIDKAHPGVAAMLNRGKVYLAGDIQVLSRSPALFPDYSKDPAQTRAYFRERNWKSVVGFQTRNPIHRAHEYITKCALEIVDGLMIHPLVGQTKSDDIPAEVRMQCYEVLINKYYPKDRVLLAVYPAAMRYAGPREAIFHAIARKNYGCTHFIVGRDHAGVGNYYGTFDAQALFDEFGADELGIVPLKFDNAFYSKAIGQMATIKTAPGGPETQLNLSGTKVREMLRKGEPPPAEFTRSEVAQILIAATRDASLSN